MHGVAGGRPESEREGSRARPLSVSQVNRFARESLEADFSSIWLVGEISNFKAHSSGHWYFSLKDERAQIGAAMFRYANAAVRTRPADGMKVLVCGTVTLYEPRGQYQVVVEKLEPRGLGDLQAAFEQLKARLREEGLFDADRKKPIPALPHRVGVVTSPTGAALRDILRVFDKRGADLHVVIAPCRVQGKGAAREIAAAIRLLNDRREAEVILVGRGGGSLEDLWPFNEEEVARAIVASKIPIVSAVGHEVDFTISDFAADLRAPTPSAAADAILRSRRELLARVGAAYSGLARSAQLAIARKRGSLDRIGSARVLSRTESRLREALQTVDDLEGRLRRAAGAAIGDARAGLEILMERLSPRSLRAEIASRRERLAAATALAARAARARIGGFEDRIRRAAGLLQSLSPLAVLERGYAICHDAAKGTVLRKADEALVGKDVRVRLSEGSLLATVHKAEAPGD